MFKYYIDKNLVIKLLETHHSKPMFNLIDSNRTYLKKWLPWVDNVKNYEDCINFIKTSKKHFIENNGFQSGIWYKQKLVGIIGYHKINWDSKKTSLGYWLSEEFVGKGIVSKSCKFFIDYAFKELNLNEIEIRCAENNNKSRKIPERLGFQQEELITKAEYLNDRYVNHIVYRIFKKEWKC